MNIFNLTNPQLVIFHTVPMANALNLHLINIYKEGELDVNSTVQTHW